MVSPNKKLFKLFDMLVNRSTIQNSIYCELNRVLIIF